MSPYTKGANPSTYRAMAHCVLVDHNGFRHLQATAAIELQRSQVMAGRMHCEHQHEFQHYALGVYASVNIKGVSPST